MFLHRGYNYVYCRPSEYIFTRPNFFDLESPGKKEGYGGGGCSDGLSRTQPTLGGEKSPEKASANRESHNFFADTLSGQHLEGGGFFLKFS